MIFKGNIKILILIHLRAVTTRLRKRKPIGLPIANRQYKLVMNIMMLVY